MTSEAAIEALTDVALFIAVYVAVLPTIYAVGEPRTRGEVMGRAIALWMCAIAGVLLIIWLAVAIVIRLGFVVHAT